MLRVKARCGVTVGCHTFAPVLRARDAEYNRDAAVRTRGRITPDVIGDVAVPEAAAAAEADGDAAGAAGKAGTGRGNKSSRIICTLASGICSTSTISAGVGNAGVRF